MVEQVLSAHYVNDAAAEVHPEVGNGLFKG
jgi:hypothetical protein